MRQWDSLPEFIEPQLCFDVEIGIVIMTLKREGKGKDVKQLCHQLGALKGKKQNSRVGV